MTRFNLQPVIGLEIHAQLLCKRKLFSPSIVSCRNPLPNTTVTLYDAAFPGTLPRLCAEPVRLAIRAGLAFQGTINCKSRFVRKHYFYGDMPAGYQITQQDSPIVSNGLIALDDGTSVRIERIQIEQDSGKTVTDLHSDFNFLDLNRAGVPLIEIVTAPDLNDSHRAVQVVRELQHVLTFLNICDGVMANGNLRVDVNVSVKDLEKPGFSSQRVEVKNLNSLKSIKKAIDYEVERQTDVIYNGGRVAQETRGFDVCLGFTHVLRSKELARDYRIFNDPDLPLLNIGNDFITSVVKSMPELPRSAAKRLQEQYNISEATAKILSSDRDVLDYFERALAIHPIHEDTPSIAANWLINEMFGRLTAANIPFVSNPVDVENFRQLVDVLQSGSVSGSAGKSILDILMEGKFNNVSDIVTAKGLNQVSDASVLRPYCLEVIKRFPQVSDYVVKGNKRKLNFLISETRKIVGDQANMSSVRSILHGLLTDDQKR